uniref:Uncharacterized protein n=1 Tax=Acrosorium ciliolatum TaxID=1550622 RepID=A0A1Z1M1S1_9FLOR|nr:hypothetical protein [Acrosorium ciliolatum]ARW59986.1 hypothetical protein [Acrosorium ciliolatum]
MNLSYLSFYSQHLNSPRTIFHKIYKLFKFITVFSILIIIIYSPSFYIFYILIFLVLLSQIFFLYFIPFFIVIKYFCIYLIYFILYMKSYNNNFIITKKYPNICFSIPFKINLFSYINKINYIKYIHLKYYIYLLPEFILRIIIIKLTYFIIIQFLFLTTKYESIILIVLLLFKKIKLLQNISYHIFTLVLSFSFHFLERIIYNFNSIYLSTRLYYKVFPLQFFNLKIYLILFITSIINFWKDIYYISSILWSRKIILDKFFILSNKK